MEIVAGDIGGTHARFALATVDGGKVASLDQIVTLRTADFSRLDMAWAAYAGRVGRPLPRSLSLAVACPVAGETLKLSNNPWTIRTAEIGAALDIDTVLLLNDFEANGHAITGLAAGDLTHVSGPRVPLPAKGVISLVGPGTGLGVAYVVRSEAGDYVAACEGGHIGYSPRDPVEDAILGQLRPHHGRVSVERIVSGPGLLSIYETLAALDGRSAEIRDDKLLWQAAAEGTDPLATAALDRFCGMLGNVAGDVALVHGAAAVVLVGRLANELPQHLLTSSFASAFAAKGRLAPAMDRTPVFLATHSNLGLLGAAVAFASR